MTNLRRKKNEWNWTTFHNWKDRSNFSEKSISIINQDTKIFGIGSCFAENVVKFCKSKGIQANFFPGSCRFYDLLSIKQVFEHLFDDEFYTMEDMWKTKDNLFRHPFRQPNKTYKTINALEKEDKQINNISKSSILEADIVIITIGGSEIWRDKGTKRGFTTIPFPDVFNHQMPDLAEVYELKHSEQLEYLNYIKNILRRVNPKSKLIFTVSPHRMTFTVTDKHIYEATCSSKSTIRSALNEFFSEKPKNCYYFRSYELIEYFEYPSIVFDENFAHVNSIAIELVMNTFMKNFADANFYNIEEYKKVIKLISDNKASEAIKNLAYKQKQEYRHLDLIEKIKKAYLLMKRIF